MKKYPVFTIDFEKRGYINKGLKTVRSVTCLHYLEHDNTLSTAWFEDGELTIVLDQNENDTPYVTDNNELHAHPTHLKNLRTHVLKFF